MGACIRCGVDIPPTGKRGRPAIYCPACKARPKPPDPGADLSHSISLDSVSFYNDPIPSDVTEVQVLHAPAKEMKAPPHPPVFPEEPDKWGDDW